MIGGVKISTTFTGLI